MGDGRPIRAINEIRTMQLGPDDVLVAASVDFDDRATARSVEATTTRLEQTIRAQYSEVKHFYLEVRSASEAAHAAGTPASKAAKAVTEGKAGVAPPSRKERKKSKKKTDRRP
jgi:hypothetical protein